MILPDLSSEQQAGFDLINTFVYNGRDPDRPPYLTVHGLAGSGKTVLLSHVAREHPQAHLVTFTGKAASVLSAKVGRPVLTIHQLIYKLESQSVRADGKMDLEWSADASRDLYEGELVLVDESSMVSLETANDLLKTGARIVAMGDPGQLPPVQGEQFFHTPDFMLREIHRQAWDSGIIRQAHSVRSVGSYADDRPDVWVIPGVDGATLLAADVVVCWKNTTRIALNRLKRRWLGLTDAMSGQLLPPRMGETVVCLMNNRELGLYNGATYVLAEDYEPGQRNCEIIDSRGERVFVGRTFFEDVDDIGQVWSRDKTPFGYGYALTCHKLQGSEYERVLIYDEYSRSDGRAQWLYTALTRASKVCAIVRP